MELWQGISKYADKIFLYLELNRSLLGAKTDLRLLSQAKKKINFQVLRASKKLKNINKLISAQDIQITALQDKWLIV